MPTYEYECTKCAHKFELFQSISAKPRSRCPECRGKVRKLISGGVGISFKGSGFYITDNSASKTRETASESSTNSKPAKTSEPTKTSESAGDPT